MTTIQRKLKVLSGITGLLTTLGDQTLKQSWHSKGPAGPAWPEQPRTECDGEGSLMAYALPGVKGVSK